VRRQIGTVGVVDLARRQCLARVVHELATRAKQGHAWPTPDRDAVRAGTAEQHPLGRSNADASGNGKLALGDVGSDFVPDALRALGAEVLFHKLRMRPGKPLLLARLAGGQLCFGLPGNPVASAVGARLFVDTALRALLGMPPELPWRLPLERAVQGKPGFDCIQKAALGFDRDGRVTVEVLTGQESFRTRPLLATTVWARLPAQNEWFAAGRLIDVHPPCHLDHSLMRSVTP
jgi:hypothetical protein